MKTNNKVVFLRGWRLNLRPLDKGEVPLYTRWVNDPDVTRFLKVNMPIMQIAEEKWLERKADDKSEIVVVISTLAGIPIGIMGAHRISWVHGTTTTGAFIGEKKYWGKGYGTEAKMLLLDYLFNTLNLRKVCSLVYAFNARSLAYSKKCGYKVEGVLKNHVFCEGRYHDVIQLAVFREDWLPLWQKYKRQRG